MYCPGLAAVLLAEKAARNGESMVRSSSRNRRNRRGVRGGVWGQGGCAVVVGLVVVLVGPGLVLIVNHAYDLCLPFTTITPPLLPLTLTLTLTTGQCPRGDLQVY